jgi:hypothetical protein
MIEIPLNIKKTEHVKQTERTTEEELEKIKNSKGCYLW